MESIKCSICDKILNSEEIGFNMSIKNNVPVCFNCLNIEYDNEE